MNNTPIVPIIYYFLGNPFFLKEFKADVNKKGGIFSQNFHFFCVCSMYHYSGCRRQKSICGKTYGLPQISIPLQINFK